MVISKVSIPKVCQVEGCGGKALARSLCCKHYYQVKRNGVVGTKRERAPRAGGASRERAPEPAGGWGGRAPSRHRCAARGCAGPLFDGSHCRLHFIKMRYLGMIGVDAQEAEPEEPQEAWEWLEEAART